MGLLADLVFRRMILELDKNVREVRATIAKSSTGCLTENHRRPRGYQIDSIVVRQFIISVN
jgi:hypothetical protein